MASMKLIFISLCLYSLLATHQLRRSHDAKRESHHVHESFIHINFVTFGSVTRKLPRETCLLSNPRVASGLVSCRMGHRFVN